MTKASDIYTLYLKPAHLPTQGSREATIERAEVKTLHPRPGQEQKAIVISFKGKPHKLILNQGNANRLATIGGDNIEGWAGLVISKTRTPNKGKRVQPSGEYDDRPAFLAMLEAVKTGDVDVIICWWDDRLVRHPRVNMAIEDALDEGDRKRKGKPKIEIVDATGAILDRFTMSIKAAVWKEENKRRVERIHMGKMGTLKAGGWPGRYKRYGYTTAKEPGQRGLKIVLAGEEEVGAVKDIFNWFDQGKTIKQIRKLLIAQGKEQKGHGRRREWNKDVITEILYSPDYLGTATWEFGNGVEMTIEIPRIIEPDQWNRVRKRLDNNKRLCERNTKGIYILQHLLKCGECGANSLPYREEGSIKRRQSL
jgi:DNA invertase Pin-like site-specific DNA recombinase